MDFNIEDTELKLLNAHQNWLAEQQTKQVQWLVAQDRQLLLLSVVICGIMILQIDLYYKVHKIEKRQSDG